VRARFGRDLLGARAHRTMTQNTHRAWSADAPGARYTGTRSAPSSAWVGTPSDEALPLLLTLSSGVTGYTTIHAGSARQAGKHDEWTVWDSASAPVGRRR
jgi:hypothetical protein